MISNTYFPFNKANIVLTDEQQFVLEGHRMVKKDSDDGRMIRNDLSMVLCMKAPTGKHNLIVIAGSGRGGTEVALSHLLTHGIDYARENTNRNFAVILESPTRAGLIMETADLHSEQDVFKLIERQAEVIAEVSGAR